MLGNRINFFSCLAAVVLLAAVVKRSHAAEPPVRIAFVGDIMLDGGPGHIVTNDGDPFAGVASILADSDLAIGNLECSITDQGSAVEKPYTFKGPVSALAVLKKHFPPCRWPTITRGTRANRGLPASLCSCATHNCRGSAAVLRFDKHVTRSLSLETGSGLRCLVTTSTRRNRSPRRRPNPGLLG